MLRCFEHSTRQSEEMAETCQRHRIMGIHERSGTGFQLPSAQHFKPWNYYFQQTSKQEKKIGTIPIWQKHLLVLMLGQAVTLPGRLGSRGCGTSYVILVPSGFEPFMAGDSDIITTDADRFWDGIITFSP